MNVIWVGTIHNIEGLLIFSGMVRYGERYVIKTARRSFFRRCMFKRLRVKCHNGVAFKGFRKEKESHRDKKERKWDWAQPIVVRKRSRLTDRDRDKDRPTDRPTRAGRHNRQNERQRPTERKKTRMWQNVTNYWNIHEVVYCIIHLTFLKAWRFLECGGKRWISRKNENTETWLPMKLYAFYWQGLCLSYLWFPDSTTFNM